MALIQAEIVVVVAVAALVVEDGPALQRVLDARERHPRSPASRAVATASSSAFSAVRASPSLRAARNSIAVVVDRRRRSPRERAAQQLARRSSARQRLQRVHAQRESSAPLTSKDGFSVVAPISVTQALLDGGQQRVLLGLVEAVDLVEEEDRPRAPPSRAGRSAARSITARTSARPACTALSSSNAACERSATIRASVVLPDPGGP